LTVLGAKCQGAGRALERRSDGDQRLTRSRESPAVAPSEQSRGTSQLARSVDLWLAGVKGLSIGFASA
jgi:hypothetical protein